MRTFNHRDFPADRLRAQRTETISVCVPAREQARAIAGVVAPLVALRDDGVIDQVVVVDADSRDGTAAIAAELGADVYCQQALLPHHGAALGKGDAIWRALSILDGDLVCIVDGDAEDFGEHVPCGLLGPLVCDPAIEFVKASYRRPFVGSATVRPTGGGRVTAITARPLLRAFFPELAGVRQPLAGEFAARRDLLVWLPFDAGDAIEMALLLDVHARTGIDAMAQVDLGVRQHREQPLEELEPVAAAVLRAVQERLHAEGRLLGAAADAQPPRRPPLADLLERTRRPVTHGEAAR